MNSAAHLSEKYPIYLLWTVSNCNRSSLFPHIDCKILLLRTKYFVLEDKLTKYYIFDEFYNNNI